jgi:hypothetical protein
VRLRLKQISANGELPYGMEYVPGLGAVRKLGQEHRWRLAGQYTVTHQLTGPWYRRGCPVCGTRGRCEYGRWADDVLVREARREWLER